MISPPSRATSTLSLASARASLLLALAAGVPGCAPAPERRGTAVVASGADLEGANPLVTVHPLSRQVQRYALLVTLARWDSALAAQPYLARSWEWSEQGRVLTLRLDPSLRWHDGRRTTARDAAFTIDAARDPATGYPRHAELAVLTEVAAPDDSTLRLRFSAAPPSFPPVLCELPIVPAHILDTVPRARMREAAFNLRPVGNGPFRFVGRDAGQRWILERDSAFPASLGGPPALERLVVAVVDEPTTKFAGLVSGELDLAGISPTMAELVERDPRLRVLSYPVLFSTALVFNPSRPPFDDVRVRRAVDASLDRTRIVDAALAGFGTPATGPVPPDSPLALATPRPAAAAADSLLDAAGWRRGADGRRARNGATLSFTLLTVGSGDNALEQLVQADLRERGISVEIRQLELGAFLAQARAPRKTFDALVSGVPGDLALSHLAAMFDSRLAGGALDYAGFHTAALDSAFARVRGAADDAALRDAWLAVQRELAREMPASWIYHSRGVQGASRRLRNVTMDLRGELVTVAKWSVGTEP